MSMRRIGVIGGGIAGLTVALRRSLAGDQVVLFEAGAQVGGQLSSELADGYLVEHGAEGFVARSKAVPALAAAAGITERVVEQLEQRSFRFDGSALLELAPGEAGRLLGFQVPTEELGRGIRSFVQGMGELPLALAAALAPGAEVRLHHSVASVAPHENGALLTDAAGAEHFFSDVVVATTARSAAALLSEAYGAPALALNDSALLSSLTVCLGYRREAVTHALDGTGFIVPIPASPGAVRAVTFCSSKLPYRAPLDRALFRLFFRPSDDDLKALGDAAWSARAERALAAALPISGSAERAWVSRWPNALPVFDDAHKARVSALSNALAGQHIWLAGAAFHGSGIDAAIRSAEATAQRL
jgi:protoporphyrinogen/coproporphyrinogen III oxidase